MTRGNEIILSEDEEEAVLSKRGANGSKSIQDRALAPNYLPRRGKIKYRLVSRAGRLNLLDVRKPSRDGRYRSKKWGIDIPIDGSKAWNGGTEIWIDADRGLQMDYVGFEEWRGPDGRWAFRAEVHRWWGAILAAQNQDILKWAKLGVILTAILIAGVLGLAIFGPGIVGGTGGG